MTKKLNQTAISSYLTKLKGSHGNPEEGLRTTEELSRDRTVAKDEVFEIAKNFTDVTVRKSDSRGKIEGFIRSVFIGEARRESKAKAMHKKGTI